MAFRLGVNLAQPERNPQQLVVSYQWLHLVLDASCLPLPYTLTFEFFNGSYSALNGRYLYVNVEWHLRGLNLKAGGAFSRR